MSEGTDSGTESFGAILRRYRGAKGLTQEELAERAGLHAQEISQLERGLVRRPRSTTVEFLGDALKLVAQDREEFAAAARRQSTERASGKAAPETHPPQPGAGLAPVPGPYFVGREAELAELDQRLQQHGHVAVCGLGGVGKTQVVAQHARRRHQDYPSGVFWLRADDESNMLGDLADLAWHLALPEYKWTEQEWKVAAVLRWLRENDRWLLVLDNLEPPVSEAMGRWLPLGLSGHVLATSRTPMWAVQLRLGPLERDAAREYLLKRTRQDDAEAADRVAQLLGGLPLALAQAAAYVEASGRPLASYAELLRHRLVELMQVARPEDYPATVTTTWRISLERLELEHPTAVALLRLCSFLAPQDIPLRVLKHNAETMPASLGLALADDLLLDQAIAALRHYSLAERVGDALFVHRLVRRALRGANWSWPTARRVRSHGGSGAPYLAPA